MESVNNVVKKINAEGLSLGAVIRNFLAVAESDDFANYMLETITKTPNAKVVLTVNDIKKAVVRAFPYKHEGKLLEKRGDLWIPMEKYSGSIIKKAFYSIVGNGVGKEVDFVPATAEQIAEATAEAEAKKAEAKKEKEEKAKNQELMAQLWQEVMVAKNAKTAWEIVNKFKVAAAEQNNK